MTPEERAKAVVKELGKMGADFLSEICADEVIAEAIRAAETQAYENGESSGYTDWEMQLSNELPFSFDDIEGPQSFIVKLRAYIKQVENDALERAAQVAENFGWREKEQLERDCNKRIDHADHISELIRGLKS